MRLSARLRELISKPEYNSLQLEYLAQGADLFAYHITRWTSDGNARTVTTMYGAAHPAILSRVISELNALRTLIYQAKNATDSTDYTDSK